MPLTLKGSETPLQAIEQRGLRIYTLDMANNAEFVCETDDPAKASWTAYSLAEYHGVPHKVGEPEEPAIGATLTIQGYLHDPAFNQVLGALQVQGVPLVESAKDDQFELRRRIAAAEIAQRG